VQDHPRHVRFDLGDFDPIIGLARLLRGSRYVGSAMLAGRRQNVAPLRRIGIQGPVRARMRLALGTILGPDRRLLPPARREARIVRRLGRPAQLGAEFGVFGAKRGDFPRKPLDRLALRQNHADQAFPVERIKPPTIHRQLETATDSAVKPRSARAQTGRRNGT
jgi:hypothetical protein